MSKEKYEVTVLEEIHTTHIVEAINKDEAKELALSWSLFKDDSLTLRNREVINVKKVLKVKHS